MAPRTSFARRDSVGTGTGGRMATSGLLQLRVVGADPAARPRPLHPRGGAPDPGRGPPFIPAQRASSDGVPGWARASAAGRRAPGPEVGEGLEGVVKGRYLGQRESRVLGRQRL